MIIIRKLFLKYKAPILYLFWGGVTTVINIVTYWLCYDVLSMNNSISNIIAWFLTISVAYITNRVWVFDSKNTGVIHVLKEIGSFFACRIATGIIDLIIMYITVDMLLLPGTPFKIVSNVIVIILNYIASKVFIFNKNSI